jgi:hypothetical protein
VRARARRQVDRLPLIRSATRDAACCTSRGFASGDGHGGEFSPGSAKLWLQGYWAARTCVIFHHEAHGQGTPQAWAEHARERGTRGQHMLAALWPLAMLQHWQGYNAPGPWIFPPSPRQRHSCNTIAHRRQPIAKRSFGQRHTLGHNAAACARAMQAHV